MANQEQLERLRQGTDAWNIWRVQHPKIQPELNEADLSFAELSAANLAKARLEGAKLTHANLKGANLSFSNLKSADLRFANLSEVNFRKANLNGANLREANLEFAQLVETSLLKANLTGCHIYGISAWNVKLERAIQSNIIITPKFESAISVDNLEIGQFIYLVLNNHKIRSAVDTLTSKAILILGRLTKERKVILEAIREELRKAGYIPVLFDFEKPASRNISESILILASLARFIIADLTAPGSIPYELAAIVPTLSIPVQPLLEKPEREYGTFEMLARYPWVLPIYHYTNLDDLLASFKDKVIAPAELKAKELETIKAQSKEVIE